MEILICLFIRFSIQVKGRRNSADKTDNNEQLTPIATFALKTLQTAILHANDHSGNKLPNRVGPIDLWK